MFIKRLSNYIVLFLEIYGIISYRGYAFIFALKMSLPLKEDKMNETLKVLETRRSCRSFKPDMVEQDKLDAILKAGTFAATGMGK